MKTIILAAGKGRKLRPFTYTAPKVLLPIANRPVLEHLLLDMALNHITEATIVAGDFSEEIEDFAASLKLNENMYKPWEEEIPRTMKIDIQKSESSVCASLSKVLRGVDESVLIINGDTVLGSHKTLGEFLAACREDENSFVVATGKIETLEHYRKIKDKTASVGLYYLPAGAVRMLSGADTLEELCLAHESSVKFVDIAKEKFITGTMMRLIDEYGIVRYEETALQRWVDVDRPVDLLDASKMILGGKMLNAIEGRVIIDPGAKVHPTAEIKGPAYVGPGAKISAHVVLGPKIWIGEDVSIDRGASVGTYTILGKRVNVGPWSASSGFVGDGSHIGHCAEFGGIMMKNAGSGHYGHLCGIIGNNSHASVGTMCGTTRIGSGKLTCEKDRLFKTYVKGQLEPCHVHGMLLGDNSFLGGLVAVMGGVKIGPYSTIGPGVMVYRDVPPNKLLMAKEEVVWRDIQMENHVVVEDGAYPSLWDVFPI